MELYTKKISIILYVSMGMKYIYHIRQGLSEDRHHCIIKFADCHWAGVPIPS